MMNRDCSGEDAARRRWWIEGGQRCEEEPMADERAALIHLGSMIFGVKMGRI